MNSIFLKVLDDKILVEANFGWLNDCAYTNYTEKDIYFYHKDHLGSSNQITDKDAVVIHHIEYMPSGEQFAEQRSTWGTSYKFNSKELDAETGLYYYGARFYTAIENIWLSVDPLSDKYPSLSPYAYCALNPVILVDPDGREMWIALESSSEQKPVFVKYKNHKLYNKDGSLYKGKDEFALNVCKSLNEIANTNDEFTKLVVNQLETSDKIHTIQKDKSGNNNNQVFPQGSNYIPVEKGERTGSNIVLSMTESPIENNLKTTNATTLGHELRHAFDYDQGLFKGSNISDKNRGTAKDPAEIRAVGFENRIRKNQNLPLRTTYGNKPIKKYNQTR